jgi:hypothetical protein
MTVVIHLPRIDDTPPDQLAPLDDFCTGRLEPAQRYEVRDRTGRLRATLSRTADKEMAWELPDGTRGLRGKERLVDLPLYGTERLRGVSTKTLIVITEGPKAADAVRRAGFMTLGTITGAGPTPSDAVLDVLRGRQVVLWPDADVGGRQHMARIAERLNGIALEVRVVEVPGASNGLDAADLTPDEIRHYVHAASRARVEVRVEGERGNESPYARGRAPAPAGRETQSSSLDKYVPYARVRVGFGRYSPAERQVLRKDIRLSFEPPDADATTALVEGFTAIHGVAPSVPQQKYLRRCYRILGPATVATLWRVYGERGWRTDNLLLALEIADPLEGGTAY